MDEATKVREVSSSTVEPEHESNANATGSDIADAIEDESGAGASYNSFDRQSETDEQPQGKSHNSKERPTVEQIQVRSVLRVSFFLRS